MILRLRQKYFLIIRRLRPSDAYDKKLLRPSDDNDDTACLAEMMGWSSRFSASSDSWRSWVKSLRWESLRQHFVASCACELRVISLWIFAQADFLVAILLLQFVCQHFSFGWLKDRVIRWSRRLPCQIIDTLVNLWSMQFPCHVFWHYVCHSNNHAKFLLQDSSLQSDSLAIIFKLFFKMQRKSLTRGIIKVILIIEKGRKEKMKKRIRKSNQEIKEVGRKIIAGYILKAIIQDQLISAGK